MIKVEQHEVFEVKYETGDLLNVGQTLNLIVAGQLMPKRMAPLHRHDSHLTKVTDHDGNESWWSHGWDRKHQDFRWRKVRP